MGRYSVDYTSPETIKLVAALPYYGQAAAVIRGIDPLWKVEIDEPREWEVRLEKWHGCNCTYCEPEIKTLKVECLTAEEARETAEREWNDWEVSDVRLPRPPAFSAPSIVVPEEFYEAASAIYEQRQLIRSAA